MEVVKNTEVAEIMGDGNRQVKQVLLTDGRRIEADMIINSTGIEPSSDFVPQHLLNGKRQVVVDNRMRTKKEGVYACGDITSFGELGQANIQHYSDAIYQGSVAA